MNILEIIKQLGSTITVTDIIICLLGITLLGIWLFKTSLGRKALADSVPRRNNMPAYLPLIPMFILFGGVRAGVSIRKSALPEIPDWQVAFLDNLILFVLGTATIMVIMFLARDTFARRLKGFGLNVKKIHKDFFAAVVNLLSIWPLVTLAIILTMFFGQLILGPEFKMEPHEELKKIVAYPARGAQKNSGISATPASNIDFCHCSSNSTFDRRDALSRIISNNDTFVFGRGLGFNHYELRLVRSGTL
jgi:hypothetical protein